MKVVLAIAMFSTYTEPVHILAVGELGGGKTLSKDIIADNFLDLTKVGANTRVTSNTAVNSLQMANAKRTQPESAIP